MPFYQFIHEQLFHASVEEMWSFISAPKNLKEITPDYMGFEITTPYLSEKMYAGMIISYKVSPVLNFKVDWVTEITHVKENEFFVDEQRIGPYKLWHHQHHLIQMEEGVLMRDIVTYQPPFGFLGALANKFLISKKLNEIFNYRKIVLEKKFGSLQDQK